MSDNKLGSINKYSVSSISKISTNTSITKRPYDGTSFSSRKGDDNSRSFKRTLKSSIPKESANDENTDFTNLLINQLNDRSILDSRETSRVINAQFNTRTLSQDDADTKINSNELHAKIKDAINIKVDTSELYKKLHLLNALKSDSNS